MTGRSLLKYTDDIIWKTTISGLPNDINIYLSFQETLGKYTLE
jgi:hypothetical protein